MSVSQSSVRGPERWYVTWIAVLALWTGITTQVTAMYLVHGFGWSSDASRALSLAFGMWTGFVASYPWVYHVRGEHNMPRLGFARWVAWVSLCSALSVLLNVLLNRFS